jgi:hypothetical protein
MVIGMISRALIPTAVACALVIPALSQAAVTTGQVEKKVERVAEQRAYADLYATCDKTGPASWSCRLTSVYDGSTYGHCRAQLIGSKVYVGRITR